MTVSEAVAARRSIRSFLDTPVSDDLLRELLTRAARAPSGGNVQPWQIRVLNGARMQEFLQHLATQEARETPAYEIISGAAIAFAAILLIIPGFATDILGFLLIFPLTRKLVLFKLSKKFKNKTSNKKTYIDGEFEDIEDDHDKKV